MKLKDLATLPKVRDSSSYLYVEHCRIEQDANAIAIIDIQGTTSVPCANLTTLMVGPGSTITHSAVKTLADNGCLVMWSGEGAVRFYALGLGETRSSRHLLRQAYLSSLPSLRLRVVRRMYEMRFEEVLPEDFTIQQLRGREGVRVRTAYSQASYKTGIPWKGRSFNKNNWTEGDPVNRALSCANSCLYGVCHAAIVSAGYSPALGFIHTGRMLSFVYDIADLYKADITIPLAFDIVKESEHDIETRTRHFLRDRFHEARFLSRIIPDIEQALDINTDGAEAAFEDMEDFAPGGLWNGGDTSVIGGVNYADPLPPEPTPNPSEPPASTGGQSEPPASTGGQKLKKGDSIRKPKHSLLEPPASTSSQSFTDDLSAKRDAEVKQLLDSVNKKLEAENKDHLILPDAKTTESKKPPSDPDDLPWEQGGQAF